MKAIQIPYYGGADVLKVVDIDRPVPKDKEVLIQVKAASLNPVDAKIRNGFLKDMIPLPLPLVPGWEASGIVTESRLEGVDPGDEVVTRVPFERGGAYAEYMIAGQGQVVAKPRELSFVEAATLPIVAGTAYTLLYKTAPVKAGDRVFLLGASGAIGLYAIQMAKALGATVIGAATADNADLLRSYGIDQIVDYTDPGFLDAVRDIDLALDFAGGPNQDALATIVKKDGHIFSTVHPGVHATFISTTGDPEVIKTVLDMAARGEIKARIGKVLPLAQAEEAHRLMDARTAGGKIVLVP